jgi:O-antigen ligase
MLPGAAVSFVGPRMAVLLLLAIFCALDLCRIVRRTGSFRLSYFLSAVFCIVFCKVVFLLPVVNAGLSYQTVALYIAVLLVGAWIRNVNLSANTLCWTFVTPAAISTFSVLLVTYAGISLLSDYAPLGAPIGLKNSLTVYLALMVPFMIAALLSMLERDNHHRSFRVAGLLALLFGMLLAIFLSRTRSAWWMIAVDVIGVAIIALRTGARSAYLASAVLPALVTLAITFGILAPNSLHWTSSTPFMDSLSSMASLRQSNGRDLLWQVGIEMVKANPVIGIGSANYPTLWPRYIASAEVDPEAFALLRPDLPIFNDYLQALIENGGVGLLLCVCAFIVLPLASFLERMRDGFGPREALLLLGCLSLSLDALVDYPFNRIETLLTFTAALEIATGRSQREFRIDAHRSVLMVFAATLIFLSVGLIRIGGFAGARAIFAVTRNNDAMVVAWRLWPWDMIWNHRHVEILWNAGRFEQAESLARTRLAAWPEDAESYFGMARLHELQGKWNEAVEMYRRAIVFVPGGRCFYPVYSDYERMISRREFAAQTDLLNESDTAACRGPKQTAGAK